MNKLRYPEKSFLSSYDLSREFFEKLGLEIIDIIPLRKVFILQTESGKMVLKKIDYSSERLNFINTCLENIHEKLPNVMTFKKFDNNSIYIDWQDSSYILMDLLPGREVAFTNPLEYEMCGKLLAKMHLASNECLDNILNKIGKSEKQALDDSLVIKFDNSLSDMKDIKHWLSSYKYFNEFDSIFIKQIDKYIEEIEKAKELLSFSGYSSYREDMNNISVCHNDLAEHNFLISDEELYLIDFDYCSIDLRVVDLADLILKGIKNAGFDIDKALSVIDAYDSICPLDREEYKFLYILLLFPRDIYSISKSYYHKEKNWEEDVFINRLKMKLANEEFRREFLKEYKERYKEKFY